jgi:predicted acyl esterase
MTNPWISSGLSYCACNGASTAKDTDFVAKLVDVFSDGRSTLVCDGCRRARFRYGFDKEVFLKPGAVTTENSKSVEKSRVLGWAAIVSRAC